jgi:hypothetical protein
MKKSDSQQSLLAAVEEDAELDLILDPVPSGECFNGWKEGEVEEKEDEKKKKETSPTTSSSSTYLVEGYCAVPPFNKIVVDIRDCVYHSMQTALSIADETAREKYGGSTLYWTAKCCSHLISSSIGLNIINSLSVYSVCFGNDGIVVLASVVGLDETKRREDEKAEEKNEWIRWRAPELTSGNVLNGNEETDSFSLGMILYSILCVEIPFPRVDCVTASKKVMNGERPNVGLLNIKHGETMKLLNGCLAEKREERVSLSLIQEVLVKMMPEIAEALKGVLTEVKKKEEEESEEGEEEKTPICYFYSRFLSPCLCIHSSFRD